MSEEDIRAEEQPDATEPQAVTGPNMMPAVIVVLAHLAAIFYSLQAASLMQVMIGFVLAPLISSIVLVAWWLRTKSIPIRERGIVLLLYPAAMLIVSILPGANPRILMLMFPVLTIGSITLLVLTANMHWNVRRGVGVTFLAACTIIFALLRVDDVRGDIQPVLAWKWSPTMEELFVESIDAEGIPNRTAALPAEVTTEDWAEFRGPGRDSHLNVTFATDWDATPPREVWRKRVGLGWGSFTAIGDYLFTQEQRGDEEVVVCYEADTGEQVWTNQIAARFEEGMGDGPRATPTYVDGELYSLGATGILQRLDPATGETVWTRDLKADSDAAIPVWGFASSPLVIGDLVVVFSGGKDGKSVIAYTREAGDIVWMSGDGKHGYASGQLATLDGVPQILFCSDLGIQSFAPETGDVLWQHEWLAMTNPRCIQALVSDDNTVMIGTAGGQGTRKLRIEMDGDDWYVSEEWSTRGFKPYFNDIVSHDGYVYGYDGSRLTCIDPATGERVWKGGRHGGQILLLSEMNILLVLSEKGDLILIEASPDGENELGRIKALSSKTWNHPVIAHGRLYIRNSEEAVCYELPTV